MENIITKLEDLEKKLEAFVKKYRNLEIEYKILKEERDELHNKLKSNTVNNKILKEESEKMENDVLSENEQKQVETDTKAVSNTVQKSDVKQIRLELNSYIADLDQCIEIIQSR